MSDKKAAWIKVHTVYNGRPIVSSQKKEAWDAVHAAYNVVSPSKNLKPASPPPIGTMSYKGMPQKEEIPGREGEGVKEVKAKIVTPLQKKAEVKKQVEEAAKEAQRVYDANKDKRSYYTGQLSKEAKQEIARAEENIRSANSSKGGGTFVTLTEKEYEAIVKKHYNPSSSSPASEPPKKEEPPKAEKPKKEVKKIVSPYAIEQWIENMVKIDLVEEGTIGDLGKEADDYIQKLQDEGEYGEIQEESLASRGHGEVAEMIYKHFLKQGNSPKKIKDSMRELIQDGYSMFEDIVG